MKGGKLAIINYGLESEGRCWNGRCVAGGRLGFLAYCLIRASLSLRSSAEIVLPIQSVEIGQFILNWKTESIFGYGGQADSEISV